ncbi:MAG: 2OG-Fe(II) oxygenase [Gracilimonas sp.]|uniref:2OG-Fe(II) oxygenase n=1 Tax=Gracilimonas TaxID=649462 RepID=UPI001B0D96F7|nr:2OG-Fe(II) oxygenase [Gracilimonas sp.]MBO6584865.1 2OG-Fe(II) oxygenase [Gracilimonas sp.]MBO6615864.1 2OG-Fe(II) oxygenase [Gracilimonas sp.]
MTFTDETWVSWMDQLAEQDYVIVDDFISDEFYDRIMAFFTEAEESDKLKKAGIGAKNDFQLKAEVRGDFIYWLDEERDQELSFFFDLKDELVQSLRRYCYLSLSGSEFHIAKYPAGTHYHRHLDQFNERTNRQITVLIYLNKDWKKGDGGELIIYKDGEEITVEPHSKRLLLFKSDTIEHEVLTTNVPRYSLTGWLLHQPANVGYLLR